MLNKIKPEAGNSCDLISLGEILLRFDPEENARIHNARAFRVFDGGAEYNVARNLSKVFRRKTAMASVLADNALGRLAEDFAMQSGVDTSEIIWREADGKGETARNGIYFIERGFGLRPPNSCFDRANTAISQTKAGDFDWRRIFGGKNVRWFHTGGVFSAISETAPEAAIEAMRIAGDGGGAIVSYDLNYRDSLWKTRGGLAAANALNRKILPLADIVFGAFDFDTKLSAFDENAFRRAAEKMLSDFPNLKTVVSTLREVRTASRHDLSAVCYHENQIYKAADYKNVEVFDRVGSGDACASGFIYGCLAGKTLDYSIECGAAHGALTMTTAGDNSMVTLAEIENLMAGGGSFARR